jgi:glycosyltransferase involved in cell wall biosynthesis
MNMRSSSKVRGEADKLSLILITPAHNEEKYIEKTIQSVVAQSQLPNKWVIVNDGSTDRTGEIVRKYLPGNEWIELVCMPENRIRNFSAKAICFNAGYERVEGLESDLIGNLDADVSFGKDVFEFLVGKFSSDPELGVAGFPFIEEGYNSITDSFDGEKHVSGQFQIFRRECLEQIGGYVSHKAGGIDWIAVTTARMKGWKTHSFKERCFFHHRKLGTGGSNRIGAMFSYGMKDYYLGGHPLWQIFRVLYRTGKRPYFIGGVALLSGYLWAWMKRMPRPVSKDLVRFHRREQMEKLKIILRNMVHMDMKDKFELGKKQ